MSIVGKAIGGVNTHLSTSNLALLGRHWGEAQSLNPLRSQWGPSISRNRGAHEASSTEETSERLAAPSSAGRTGAWEMLSGKAPEN